MDFQTSVRTVLQHKYADFSGRARRSEFWWFALFNFVTQIILQVVDGTLFGFNLLSTIFALAVLIPSIAVGVRRLHDRDMAGWWILLVFIPVLGALALLVLYALEGTKGPNRFGKEPRVV